MNSYDPERKSRIHTYSTKSKLPENLHKGSTLSRLQVKTTDDRRANSVGHHEDIRGMPSLITQAFSVRGAAIEASQMQKSFRGTEKLPLIEPKKAKKVCSTPRDFYPAEVIETDTRKRNLFKTLQKPTLISRDAISNNEGYLHTILLQPRSTTKIAQTLIIVIEGVLASCLISLRKTKSLSSFVFRDEMVSVLKNLSLYFEIVLVSGWSLGKIFKVLNILTDSEVYISAAYKLVGKGLHKADDAWGKRHLWYLDYSRIYKDFKISTREEAKNLLVLVPSRVGPEEPLVEDRGFYVDIRLERTPVPTAEFPFVPVTFCVPHLEILGISMEAIASIVFLLSGYKNFYSGCSFINLENVKKFKTSAVFWELVSTYTVPGMRELLRKEERKASEKEAEVVENDLIVLVDGIVNKPTILDKQMLVSLVHHTFN